MYVNVNVNVNVNVYVNVNVNEIFGMKLGTKVTSISSLQPIGLNLLSVICLSVRSALDLRNCLFAVFC